MFNLSYASCLCDKQHKPAAGQLSAAGIHGLILLFLMIWGLLAENRLPTFVRIEFIHLVR